MGGQDHRAVGSQRGDERAESHALLGVEPGRGLVHHEQARVAHERLRDAHAPPHAARETADAPAANICQPHALDKLVGLAAALALVVHTLEDAHVVEELRRREVRIGLDVLRQVSEGLLERAAVARLGDIAAVNQHVPAGGAHDATQDAHERGLAGAVGADEPDHARGQVEREVVEGAGPLVEVLAQAVEGDEHGSPFYAERRLVSDGGTSACGRRPRPRPEAPPQRRT